MSDVYQAPEASLNEPVADGQYGSVENALAGNYELKPIEVVKEAWDNLSGMKGTFWGAAVIYYIVALVFAFLPVLFIGSIEPSDNPTTFQAVVPFIIQIVQTIVLTPMAMGLAMIALKHAVGANIQVGEIFKHFHKTLPLFLTYILMVITIMIGLLLLVIPGIYLMIAYAMAMMLVVEKDMGPWEALNTSRKAVTHKWFNMLGFMIVAMFVVMVGMIALMVGLVWAVPLVALAFAMIYRDMFGVESKTLNS